VCVPAGGGPYDAAGGAALNRGEHPVSHVAAIKFCITDLEALKVACEKRGLEFVEGQKTFKWFGQWVDDYNATDAAYRQGFDPKNYGKCEHAIRIPGDPNAYEIGVVKNPDGVGYSLMLDFWDGGKGMVAKAGGKTCDGLIQDYSIAAARNNENVQSLVNELNCAEHQVFDAATGDVILIYEDEGMTDQQVHQYLGE
jgi:hypothetical protein